MSEANTNSVNGGNASARMGRLLDDLGWAALLIVTGVFWMIPEGKIPSGSWLMAVGSVILLFTIARFMNHVPVSGIALAAGIIAVIAGIGSALNMSVPIVPIALIVIGCCFFLVRQTERTHPSSGEDQPCCR